MLVIKLPGKDKEDKIELKPVSWETDFSVWKMLQEIGKGENGFHNEAYGKSPSEFCKYIKKLITWSNGENMEIHLKKQTTYFLYFNQEPVGIGKLRVYHSEAERHREGDVSYTIRPGFRRRGLGKKILQKLLIVAWKNGLNDVILSCDCYNQASRNIIEANKGILDKIEQRICFYRIKLR